jgi:NADH:ubiquinone oxidoreductase subunit 5 (subunit L)/multisubunit Na+/H+ antiporter MnhA subunit
MTPILLYFLLIPFIAVLISAVLPKKNESLMSGLAIGSIAFHLGFLCVFILSWLINGHSILDYKSIVLYTTGHFEFAIRFYFDKTTAVFGVMGSLIALLVALFSKTYMHREEGFKRYFVVLLLFFFGYQVVVFSGNFETLFIGWEVLGICSFLLIGFYRDRYLPVKNSLKVISVYRLGDVCLILAMWLAHHIFHQNISFLQTLESSFITSYTLDQKSLMIMLSLMIVIAAAAKSALLPFSSWLPRAMEGPTTSSAVFYGALSIHLGAFLLIRTYPIWQELMIIKVVLVIIGIMTAIVASSIARVQSTVKTQIAYASITQIGWITIEIALGWHILALVHFAGNAFLRTYQLLISPSILSYQIHDMVFNFKPAAIITRNHWSSKWSDTFIYFKCQGMEPG